jgi:hypothetical protein
VGGDQEGVEGGVGAQLCVGEVEERGQVAAVGQAGRRVPQLVEERVRTAFDRLDPPAKGGGEDEYSGKRGVVRVQESYLSGE